MSKNVIWTSKFSVTVSEDRAKRFVNDFRDLANTVLSTRVTLEHSPLPDEEAATDELMKIDLTLSSPRKLRDYDINIIRAYLRGVGLFVS